MKINHVSDSSNALHEQILDAFLDGQQIMMPWNPEIERQNKLICLGPGSIDFDNAANQSSLSHDDDIPEEENKKQYYSPPPKRKPKDENEKRSTESIESDELKQIQQAIELSIQDETRRRSGIHFEEIVSRTESDEEIQKAIEFSIMDERRMSLQRSNGQLNMIGKSPDETDDIALAIQLSMEELSKDERDVINRRLKKGKGRAS
jgi:hypothetical protein